MKKFICIVVDAESKTDLKEYEISANYDWEALYKAKAQFKLASHYTPRLPPIESVIFDLVEIN